MLSSQPAGAPYVKVIWNGNQVDLHLAPLLSTFRALKSTKAKVQTNETWATGLLASSGQFNLGTNVLEQQRHSREIEEEKWHQKAAQAKDIYDALHVKVQVIREKNLLPEQWTVAQLNMTIQ
jgi:hypothetical protein